MKVLDIAFIILPFIMIGGTLTLILGASLIKKEEIKKKILIVTGVAMGIYIYVFMGIIIPISFLSAGFDGLEGILYVIAFSTIAYLLISICVELRNSIILKKNDIKDIYVRDVEVKYSPAVLSYLINQKIEKEKDLSATLLNLCAKNILKIDKMEEKTIKIIDMKNNEAVDKLSADEHYAYNMFVDGVTTKKINIWRKKVEEEYKKFKFSKEHKSMFTYYIMGIYAAIFIGCFIYMIISGNTVITGKLAEYIEQLILIVFFTAWESAIVYSVRKILSALLNKETPKEFRDKYSKKGAREYMKWKKFEKFIEDFTLVEEKDYASIEVLGKYLSYSIALEINKKCDKEVYEQIKKQYTFELGLFENI